MSIENLGLLNHDFVFSRASREKVSSLRRSSRDEVVFSKFFQWNSSVNYLHTAKTAFLDDFRRFLSSAIRYIEIEDYRRLYRNRRQETNLLSFVPAFFSSLVHVKRSRARFITSSTDAHAQGW